MTYEERHEIVKEIIDILAKHSLNIHEADIVLETAKDGIAYASKVQAIKD